jgi:hypothetical protein
MPPMSRAKNAAFARPDRARPVAIGRNERAGGEASAASSHIEALLDEALAETFPASDPVALLWRGGATPNDN